MCTSRCGVGGFLVVLAAAAQPRGGPGQPSGCRVVPEPEAQLGVPASSSSHGGSAPARVHVTDATSVAAMSAPWTGPARCRSDLVSPLPDHQATNAPPNASPAPIVSTTGTTGTATLISCPGRKAQAGRGPSVTSTSRGPCPSRPAAAARAVAPG